MNASSTQSTHYMIVRIGFRFHKFVALPLSCSYDHKKLFCREIMTTYSGNLRKMHVGVDESNTAQYHLPIGDTLLPLNALIGQNVTLTFNNKINCVHCDRVTKKSFNQGYCYPCLQKLAQCDTCIIKPEQCHYAKGTCREPQWAEAHCFNDHIVYLSNTGNVKVGITRQIQSGVSSRWIDQGATQAIPIFRVANRLISGLVETICKQHMSDKSNWRVMLKGAIPNLDLVSLRDELYEKIADDLEELITQHGLLAIQKITIQPVDIFYPVTQYPAKITSLGFDKTPSFTGTLLGIKGQYLYFDDDRVINIRKHAGYDVHLQTNP